MKIKAVGVLYSISLLYFFLRYWFKPTKAISRLWGLTIFGFLFLDLGWFMKIGTYELDYYFLGYGFLFLYLITHIRNLNMKSKAFVFPSKWYEGSPLVVPEMLSYGLPCIVSDCSSAKEEIINGVTGLAYVSGFSSLRKTILEFQPIRVNSLLGNDFSSYLMACLAVYNKLSYGN